MVTKMVNIFVLAKTTDNNNNEKHISDVMRQ